MLPYLHHDSRFWDLGFRVEEVLPYLHHDDRSTSLVEVWGHLGQQHIKPAVHMLQVVRITGSEMHFATTHNLQDHTHQSVNSTRLSCSIARVTGSDMHSATNSTCNITVTHLLKTQEPEGAIGG